MSFRIDVEFYKLVQKLLIFDEYKQGQHDKLFTLLHK